MEEKIKHIEELLERFFEGQTSNAEEQELYIFFGSDDLPEHLAPYKPVFGYFETGLMEEIQSSSEKQASVKPLPLRRKVLMVLTSVAAVVLAFFLLQPLFTHQNEEPDPFEGSFIVRNGERIDDLDQIRPELELKMQLALLQEERADRLLNWNADDEDPLQMIEQELKAQYCELIHQFPDEAVQQEVKDILQIECE
ncbi:hypothetical protein [Parabacteroides sp. PF5-6]|uniref:hypothetical protein n=1 Tax=Parabacteroides sp. PF5-6 TaxID=1742403 RepID=UPI0024074C55|nr:hypothetical protein [Parabacteroides sp. PF5-6]MDF9828746.1 hypothetical protein [Parabacteroides sp. PF5-6]